MLIKRFGAIRRTYRHFQRYREVVTVFLKHGFSDLVTTLGLTRYLSPWRRPPLVQYEEVPRLTRPMRLRLVMEELGPTFVKLGQMLSTRPDIMGPEYIVELSKLQDTVPSFPAEEAKQIIEAEFKSSITDLFEEFSEQPLASASIAQVHAARANGKDVVVKIRRPNIRSIIETDLEIMADLAALLEKFMEGASIFEPVRVVREFSRVIHRELDLSSEACNMERFGANFEDDARIRVPGVIRSLTTSSVLTMERIRGTKITCLEAYAAHELDQYIVAERGAQLLLEQVFYHGFFHADPHPGNIVVCPDNVICFLDYGMMGILSSRRRDHLIKMVEALASCDERRLTAAVLRLSDYNRFEKVHEIESDIANFIQDQLYRPLKYVKLGELLNELTRLLLTHNLHMPSDFFLLTKSLTTLEGVGRVLHPEFDVLKHLEPFVRKMARQRTSLKTLRRDLFSASLDLQSLLRDLPSESREILTLLKRGEVRLKFEHRGLDNFIRSNDQISNRIVFALVLASLVIGSSLIAQTKLPPLWNEIPILGVAGFTVSGLMAFLLLISIIRHGKM